LIADAEHMPIESIELVKPKWTNEEIQGTVDIDTVLPDEEYMISDHFDNDVYYKIFNTK